MGYHSDCHRADMYTCFDRSEFNQVTDFHYMIAPKFKFDFPSLSSILTSYSNIVSISLSDIETEIKRLFIDH